jgi:hypothetical protein
MAPKEWAVMSEIFICVLKPPLYLSSWQIPIWSSETNEINRLRPTQLRQFTITTKTNIAIEGR